jgi:LPXTG-motif cell wall-anchored protein
MKRLEHYTATPHTAMIAGKNLPTEPAPANAASAAVADTAAAGNLARATASSSNTPFIVAGAVVLGAGAFALWWFKWRRRR